MIEKKDTYVEESRDLAEKMMGSLLARILHLENLMRNIMTQHFCSDDAERAALFLSSITPDMNFRNKINIFMNMLKIYYNDIYKTHDSDLKKLYELDQSRNDLLHLMSSTSGEDLDRKDADCAQMLKSKKGRSITGEAAKEEHESRVRLCIKLSTVLYAIQREVIASKFL
jgi:hypothetical protein